MELKIITPNSSYAFHDIEIINFNAFHGEMGVMPGHENMIVILNSGPIFINGRKTLSINGGLAEISANEVIILSEGIEDIQ